nr:hypothetical protein [Halieaceae bacterium]
MDTEPPDEVMEIYGGLKDIRDPQEQLDVFMRSMSMMPVSIKGKVDVALDTQIADQKFVIESIPSLQSELVDLRPHVDLDKVGLFGMSIGGSAAVLTCSEDTRCGAAVNLDGFHPAQALVEIPVPLLALHRSDNLLLNANFERAQTDAYLVEIAGSTHFNYFDFTIISPLLKKMGILGPIDGEEMVGISRDFITTFFDTHLKGEDSPLLEGREEHESQHVTLQHR